MRRPIDLDPEFAGRILPRHDLRIEAFRRYEPIIARACSVKSLTLSEFELPVGTTGRQPSAKTFVARFSDAKLGYKRYNYPSALIPKGFDVDNLVAYELTNNTVAISNYALSTQPVSIILSSDHTTITLLFKSFSTFFPGTKIPIRIVNPTDLSWLKAQEDLYPNLIITDPEADLVWVTRTPEDSSNVDFVLPSSS